MLPAVRITQLGDGNQALFFARPRAALLALLLAVLADERRAWLRLVVEDAARFDVAVDFFDVDLRSEPDADADETG